MPAYAMTSPAETTAPVAGTTAGLYTFATPVMVANITNLTGQTAYLAVNTTTAASTTVYDLTLADGATSWALKAADLGVKSIKYIGVWIPSGGTVAAFRIRG